MYYNILFTLHFQKFTNWCQKQKLRVESLYSGRHNLNKINNYVKHFDALAAIVIEDEPYPDHNPDLAGFSDLEG